MFIGPVTFLSRVSYFTIPINIEFSKLHRFQAYGYFVVSPCGCSPALPSGFGTDLRLFTIKILGNEYMFRIALVIMMHCSVLRLRYPWLVLSFRVDNKQTCWAATMVVTRTFCCCIPVRAGAIIIAIIGLLGGGALATAGGLQAHRMTGNKVSIAITITVYALLAILSILGFIGAVARRLHLIKIYFGMLLAHLIFSMGIGGFSIFRVFRDAKSYYEDCVHSYAGSESPTSVCTDGVKIVKGVTVSLFIVLWLFEIWGCVIVSNYSKQLAAEKSVHGVVKDTEAW